MKQNKVQNMLLGVAIGDAFGAGYEFIGTRNMVGMKLDMAHYTQHPNRGFRH